MSISQIGNVSCFKFQVEVRNCTPRQVHLCRKGSSDGEWGVVTPANVGRSSFLGRAAVVYVQGLPKDGSALCYVQGYERSLAEAPVG